MSNRSRTLEEAYEISLYQELILENKKHKIQPRPSQGFAKPVQSPKSHNTHVQNQQQGQKLENKCYKCHNPWVPGHRCREKAVHTITGEEVVYPLEAWPVDTDDEVEVQMQELLLQSFETDNKQEDVRISLHAIGEARSLDLIRIQGEVNGVPVIALVDCGSTHSFVDPKVVEKAGFKASQTKPMEITVANGSKMYCDEKCDGFTWVMQGQEFKYYLKIMGIGTYEMLLGGDWLKKVGPILLDVGSLALTMVKDGKKVVLGLECKKEERKISRICFIY